MVYEQYDLVLDLPENTQYQDEGCLRFYSCLKCVFPWCFYDLSNTGTKLFKQYRNQEIIRLAGEGVKTRELATFFKITQRCIEQVLRKAKEV